MKVIWDVISQELNLNLSQKCLIFLNTCVCDVTSKTAYQDTIEKKSGPLKTLPTVSHVDLIIEINNSTLMNVKW